MVAVSSSSQIVFGLVGAGREIVAMYPVMVPRPTSVIVARSAERRMFANEFGTARDGRRVRRGHAATESNHASRTKAFHVRPERESAGPVLENHRGS